MVKQILKFVNLTNTKIFPVPINNLVINSVLMNSFTGVVLCQGVEN